MKNSILLKTMLTLLASLAGLLGAATAFAAPDGVAQYRLDTNGIDGFAYQTDSAAPGAVQTEFWRNGRAQGTLIRTATGTWEGRLGMQSIIDTSLKVNVVGDQISVRIRTNPGGVFDYTVRFGKKGDIQISGMTASGNLALASLSKDGTQLSVDGTRYLLSLSESRKKPDGSYTGTALPVSGRGFGETARLTAQGRLYPPTVFNDDIVLYLLLYVLPFQEAHWPAGL